MPRLRPRRPHHSHPPHAPFAASVALLALIACGGGDQRVTETADSAVAYGAAPFDSGRVDSSGGNVDTMPADTAIGVETPRVTSPEFVLVADSVAGREFYNGVGTCFTCHALDGSGVTPLGSNIRDSVWTHIDGSLSAITRVIRDGIPVSSATRRGMPAFGSRLSEADLYRLSAYTYTLSHPGSAVADTASADSLIAPPADTSIAPR